MNVLFYLQKRNCDVKPHHFLDEYNINVHIRGRFMKSPRWSEWSGRCEPSGRRAFRSPVECVEWEQILGRIPLNSGRIFDPMVVYVEGRYHIDANDITQNRIVAVTLLVTAKSCLSFGLAVIWTANLQSFQSVNSSVAIPTVTSMTHLLLHSTSGLWYGTFGQVVNRSKNLWRILILTWNFGLQWQTDFNSSLQKKAVASRLTSLLKVDLITFEFHVRKMI